MRPANDELRAVGVALAALRVKKGYKSQVQLGIASGVAPATISNIEAGKEFKFGTLVVLLNTMGVNASDFLYEAGLANVSVKRKKFRMIIEFEADELRHPSARIDKEE